MKAICAAAAAATLHRGGLGHFAGRGQRRAPLLLLWVSLLSAFWVCLSPDSDFKNKGPNLSKPVGKEGRNCTSLCPHSVSPLLHAVVHSYNIPTDHKWLLKEPTYGLTVHKLALFR